MEKEQPAGKLPIPSLPTTAYTAKKIKKRKTPEERLEAKRLSDNIRNQTRVNLGLTFKRWRLLRNCLGFHLDQELAVFLIDSYEKSDLNLQRKSESDARSAEPQPDQCPSCGFILPQQSLQNGKGPNREPDSIEVTLEPESKDQLESLTEENLSDREMDGEEDGNEDGDEDGEENGDSEVSESKEESVESWVDNDKSRDWTPPPHIVISGGKPAEAEAAEEEMDSGEGEDKPLKKRLCPECGSFYMKIPHECCHKTKPFVCNNCGKRFSSKLGLRYHERAHTDAYKPPCIYCYATFQTKGEKLAHERNHQQNKDPFNCPECEETFFNCQKRNMHVKQHRDKNPFKCAVCGIVYTLKKHYLRHIVVHTGEKAFKCSVCERSFKQDGHLRSHMRLHTGERPYSCKHCGKSFNHNVSLKSHLQRYHPTEQEEKETDTKQDEERSAAKAKPKRSQTGRPVGRPKRNATAKRKCSKSSDESEDS